MNDGAAGLSIEDVRKLLPAPAGGTVEILGGVSLEAKAGELTTVIGPSGGGKSTLVRLINRLDDPTSGRILIGGIDIAGLDPLLLRRRVGLVLQKPFMFPGTVLDNLHRPFLFRGEEPPGGQGGALRGVLDLCAIDTDLLERDAGTLSVGQQQRVSLAGTLLPGPEVLLLDEPTSGLDRPTGNRLADTLREICRSRRLTVLMVTHDLRLAERVADRVAYLERGRILEEGGVDVLRNPCSEELRCFLAEPAERGE